MILQVHFDGYKRSKKSLPTRGSVADKLCLLTCVLYKTINTFIPIGFNVAMKTESCFCRFDLSSFKWALADLASFRFFQPLNFSCFYAQLNDLLWSLKNFLSSDEHKGFVYSGMYVGWHAIVLFKSPSFDGRHCSDIFFPLRISSWATLSAKSYNDPS